MSLAVLCPGQGDQDPAFLDRLRDHPRAIPVLEALARVLGRDPRTLSPDAVHRNAVAQPFLCGAVLATWAILADVVATPSIFAGYSVGELAAHGCAGALRPDAVIATAVRRAELMDTACVDPNGLVALRGLDARQIAPLCADTGCHVAIVNGTDRFVIGGRRDGLAGLEEAATRRGAKVTRLDIAIASHTPLMTPAAAPFRAVLERCDWAAHGAPVLDGTTAAPVRSRAVAVEALSRQIDHTIRWSDCLDALVERGATVFLEIGPGTALSTMARDRFPRLEARSFTEFAGLDGLAAWLGRALAG